MQPLSSITLGLALAATVSAQATRPIAARAPTESLNAARVDSPAALDRDDLARRFQPIARERHDELYFEVESDGTQWVRGRTYKASFGAHGATYIPFLGSHAPRNYPVGMSLASARVGDAEIALTPIQGAERDGTNVRIARGAIDEVYELGLDGVEQTFVVKERPAAGDLHLFVALDAELTRREIAEGVELANELGSVRYGRAFVRSANGARTAVASHLAAGGVEIVVPESMLASASYPLVVDPLVSTFAINTSSYDDTFPDVAYDVTTDRYLVTYSMYFSAIDSDVACDLVSGTGVDLLRQYIDTTGEDWNTRPKCANLRRAHQFLVAGGVSNVSGFAGQMVRARTVDASTIALSAKFNISAAGGARRNCDVGGDPYIGVGLPAYYCVVWESVNSSLDIDVEYCLVASDTTIPAPGVRVLANSTNTRERFPSISKSDAAANWSVAWQRDTTSDIGDIYAARISYTGNVVTAPFAVNLSVADDGKTSVSTPRLDGTYMIAWERDQGTQSDIYAALVRGSTVLDQRNISILEDPLTSIEDQRNVDIDTDGDQFTLVYNISVAGSPTDYDIRTSSWYTLADQIGLAQGPEYLAQAPMPQMHPQITGQFGSGGPVRHCFVAWDEEDIILQTGNIHGALYDGLVGGPISAYCFGDGSNATLCPCGNTGATGHGCGNSVYATGAELSALGSASLAADTVQLTSANMPANVTCTFFQGTTGSATANVFGDGLRCTGGSVIRLKTRNANSVGRASFPAAGDASLSSVGAIPSTGGVRYYQVNYRNSANFCTAATFNITNGIRAVWLP